jgi:hypothetical protein
LKQLLEARLPSKWIEPGLDGQPEWERRGPLDDSTFEMRQCRFEFTK